MGQDSDKGHSRELKNVSHTISQNSDFVLEKDIFTNIFEKDIRRVFIYKKAERLAKGLHLIAPAFTESPSLKNRLDAIAIALIDASLLPPHAARLALSRELLALSSMLALARTSGLLSPMNADLIIRESQNLLQEIAGYEEPRLHLGESPTISSIARQTVQSDTKPVAIKRHEKDMPFKTELALKDRKESVLSVITERGGRASIKDISTIIRHVSEKTIQRELSALVSSGRLIKQGERRWSVYSIV
jgi:hypothetical protein